MAKKKKSVKGESAWKFIASLLPAMESTTCISSQAGRQMMRRENEEEEEEEEKVLGSSAKK